MKVDVDTHIDQGLQFTLEVDVAFPSWRKHTRHPAVPSIRIYDRPPQRVGHPNRMCIATLTDPEQVADTIRSYSATELIKLLNEEYD